MLLVEKSTTNTKTTLTIIWLAMAQSHLLFAAISYLVFAKENSTPVDQNIVYVFFGIAMATATFSWLMNQKAKKLTSRRSLSSASEKNDEINKAMPLYITSWATCEAISIMGLVIVNMFGKPVFNQACILFIVGISLHLLEKPKV